MRGRERERERERERDACDAIDITLKSRVIIIIGSAEALPILCVSDFCERERERERERRL